MNIGNMAEKAAEKTAPKGVKNKIVSAAWQLFHDNLKGLFLLLLQYKR